MVDHATPNLPSRQFGVDATISFYAALGFTVVFRDAGWQILSRGHLLHEFFPDANPQPHHVSLRLVPTPRRPRRLLQRMLEGGHFRNHRRLATDRAAQT